MWSKREWKSHRNSGHETLLKITYLFCVYFVLSCVFTVSSILPLMELTILFFLASHSMIKWVHFFRALENNICDNLHGSVLPTSNAWNSLCQFFLSKRPEQVFIRIWRLSSEWLQTREDAVVFRGLYPHLAPTHLRHVCLLPCSASLAPLDRKNTGRELGQKSGAVELCFDMSFFPRTSWVCSFYQLILPCKENLVSARCGCSQITLCVCVCVAMDKCSCTFLLSRRRNQVSSVINRAFQVCFLGLDNLKQLLKLKTSCISWGRRNKMPKNGWLKHQKLSSHSSGGWQVHKFSVVGFW